MKNVSMNQPFTPTKIITGSFSQTLSAFNINKDKNLGDQLIGYLLQTHCLEITNTEMISSIDFLKVVLPVNSIEELSELKELISFWLRQVGIGRSNQLPALRYHKKGVKLFPLDESHSCCGSFKWDDNKLQLELTGSGCHYIKTSDLKFLPLYALLAQYGGKITEVDIATDDLTGKYNLRYTKKAYSAGDYNPKRGMKPVRNPEKEYQGSLYLGRSDSAKSMCVYEKWRELKLPKKHPLYGKWTRHELKLRRRNSHILTLDILTNPDGYFVGAYPKMHKRLINNVEPRSTVREKSTELTQTLSKAVAYAKHQYGSTINVFSRLVANDKKVLSALKRQNTPKSFELPSYLDMATLKKNFIDENHDNFSEHLLALVDANAPSKSRVA
ncbi:replication initiation factor domain-containing protein [Thalassotalea sp. PLHSN55]|uniref:replication initiation factor domain-containing protein n=1 Tax=Thalassotalea sp. PLHSN55 TaxID=3435888 RepID=UPI003F854892